MKTLSIAAALALLLLTAFTSAQPVSAKLGDGAPQPAVAKHIFRQPDLSPDGKTVAFVYDGDIWSVPYNGGTARRLTITEDNENSPIFSPDGKWIAFRSVRYGHDDVFVMPAAGGPARRLTWADGWDDPCCWLPDSSGIIFRSWRQDYGGDLWVVRLKGGEPWPITDGGFRDSENNATISPNGKHIAYVRRGGTSSYRRRGYNGTSNNDVWVCDFDGVTTRNHRPLTSSRAHETWPVFLDNDRLLYVSFARGKEGTDRVSHFAFVSISGKSIRQSMRTMVDVREPSIAKGKVVFTSGNYGGWNLSAANLGGSRSAPIKISLSSDVREQEEVVVTRTSADEFAVSPDGKKIAFIAGGDVYVRPVEEGGTPRRLTNTAAREKDLAWSPDSERVAYASRRSGNYDIYGMDLVKREESLAIDEAVDCTRPVFVREGNALAYLSGERAIKEYDPETRESKLLVEGYFQGANRYTGPIFEVSGDGRWLLFELPNENQDDAVYVTDLEEGGAGERHQLSHLFGNTAHPRFSQDGKRVLYSCSQEGDYDIYSVELKAKELEFKEDKLDNLFKTEDEDEEDDKEAEKKDKKKEESKVEIDFEGLRDRTRRITTLDGNEFYPVALKDGKTYLFIAQVQGQRNIWKLVEDPIKGPNLKQLTTSRSRKSDLVASADGKSVYYLDGGKITQLTVSSGKTKTYPFKVVQRRNRRELRRAGFDEAVWVMDRYYYDAEHHGQDWKALTSRYAQALDAVGTGDEWGGLMNELWGELNSSHQGFYASDPRTDNHSESAGWLGLRFNAAELSRGRYLIDEVLKRGPCDRKEFEIRAGDYLLAINGVELSVGSNIYRMLGGAIGKKTLLRLGSSTVKAPEREIAMKPISRSATLNLYYRRWVDRMRQMVHKLSDGQLGYVHIRSMGDSSLRNFKHHLGDDILGRKGVVIDVRFNGGGYTAVHLLEILMKKTWLKRTSRGLTGDVSENIYRSVALEKPSCLLINQSSFSNAEIMAEGFKRLKIGKVIGMETAGGVIGTSSYSLIDGSRMRMPVSGAYAVDGENLENNGRKPDIAVDNTPEDINAGRDRQIEVAVRTLLKEIE